MYKLNDEKMFADLADGQAIVINTATGMYYAMNLLSSAIFDALRNGASEAAVLQALKAVAGCPENIDRMLEDFLRELKSKEILVELSGESPACTISISEELLEEGWELTVEEYNEVQDLITADPVHDVDDEAGWPVLKKDN